MVENRFWKLHHPGAPTGIVREEPVFQEQDAKASSAEGYAVVFFPKITGLGKATLDFPGVARTLSQTPEAAISKFMDAIKSGQKWSTYHDAGHRVRRLRFTDLGDAVAAEETPGQESQP